MAVEQLEDNIDLWVENEIARQLQTVSLDDDNSDLKVEVEPAVSPEKESSRKYLLAILESYKGSLELQLQHGTDVVRDAEGTLRLVDRVLDKSSPPSDTMLTIGSDGGQISSYGNAMSAPPTGSPGIDPLEPVCVSPSLQEALSKLEEEGHKRAEVLNQELAMREAAINAMIEEAERQRKEQEETTVQREALVRTRAAIALQSHWRCRQVRKLYSKELHRRREGRLMAEKERVEARWREREKVRNEAAIVIQSCWRGYHWRCKVGPILREHRREREGRGRKMEAAVTIQTYWRGKRHRRTFCMELARRRKEEELEVELAQRRKEELEEELAQRRKEEELEVKLAQRRKEELEEELAQRRKEEELEVELAQRKKEEELMHIKMETATILIQSFWRGCVVRKCVVPALIKQREMFQQEKDERELMAKRRVERAVIAIQRCWRRSKKRVSMRQELLLLPSSPLPPSQTLAPQPSCTAEADPRHMAAPQTTPLPPSSPPSSSLPHLADVLERSGGQRRRKLTLKRRLQSALMVLSQPLIIDQLNQATPLPASPSCQTPPHSTSSPPTQLADDRRSDSAHVSPHATNSSVAPVGVRSSPIGPPNPPSSSSSLMLPVTRSTPSFSPVKRMQGGAWETSSSTPSILSPSPRHNSLPTSSALPPTRSMPHPSDDSVHPAEVAVGNELSAMASLQRVRKQEEGVADDLRDMMSRLVSKETLVSEARARRSKSSHAQELEHFSTLFSPQAWLGLVEERRVQWSKTHVPWREPSAKQGAGASSEAKERTGDCTKRTAVKSEARPLSDLQLLSASPPGTKPSEVVQVSVFRSQSPVDVTCLSRCPHLQTLTLTKCGISSPCGLSSCSQLVELNLQANALEQLVEPARSMDNVRFMDLSGNRITLLVGLEGCPGLLELSVSENRITRIGGMPSCSKLQKLVLDNNLLVNTGGLESLPSLHHLSCIGNHLPRVSNLNNSPLLQYLNLQQNNLCEAPPLMNHVLLRELRLEENNLSDVHVLTSSWLPLLQNLSLANNSISSLDSLSLMLSLETLDIRNNSICDLPLFLHALRGCFSLTSLALEGNPLTEDPRWRRLVQGVLPSLLNLNDQEVTRPKQLSFPTEVRDFPLYQLCRRQLKEQDDLIAHHNQELLSLVNSNNGSPEAVTKLLNGKVRHHQDWHSLLVKHLREHEEYGDDRIVRIRVKAATAVQAVWRGRRVRGEVALLKALKFKRTAAAIVLQTSWRRHRSRRVWSERRKKAAIVIQSHFRGYWLRRRLREIMESARYEDSDEEDMEYEEVLDLGYVDEALLEGGVELVRLGMAHPPDGLMEEDSVTADDHHCANDGGHVSPGVRHQAWTELECCVPSEGNQVNPGDQRPNAVEDHIGKKNKLGPMHINRSEAITQEWGFRDLKTTEMMLRRALRQRNLIAQADRRKKMEDPAARLACFRKMEHSHHSTPVMSINPSNSHVGTPSLQAAQKRKHHAPATDTTSGSVYQWAHNHRMVYREANPPHRRGHGEEGSDSWYHRGSSKCSLPQLDSHVLAGHKTRLVSAEALNHVVEKQLHSSNKDVR
eukprot:Em0003g593a